MSLRARSGNYNTEHCLTSALFVAGLFILDRSTIQPINILRMALGVSCLIPFIVLSVLSYRKWAADKHNKEAR